MKPPKEYYAAIFTSTLSEGEGEGYEAMARRMVELASSQEGFLGVESVRNEQGYGITVSYWESEASIRNWKMNAEHLEAQSQGRETWYDHFHLRIAKVEREYHFQRKQGK